MQMNIEQLPTIVDTRVFSFQKPTAFIQTPFGLYYHIVFRASENLDLIEEGKRKKFYGFIFGCARTLDGTIKSIGGSGVSIHLLVSMNSAPTPADFVKKIKLFTSSWAKRKLNLPEFQWLDEEVSTVSHSQCARVGSYIQSRSFLF